MTSIVQCYTTYRQSTYRTYMLIEQKQISGKCALLSFNFQLPNVCVCTTTIHTSMYYVHFPHEQTTQET